MKKTLYEQTIDGVTAPEETVERMLNAVRSNEKEKIIPMKNRNHHIKHIRTAVIAASLVAVIALGAVFGVHLFSPKDNPFVLSVNAAEITDTGYTAIGTLNDVGGAFTSDERSVQATMTEYFIFDVRVDGDKVRSVRYTVENGWFEQGAIDEERMLSIDQNYVVPYGTIESEEDKKDYTYLCLRADSYDTTLPEEARQAVRDFNDHANYKLGLPLEQADYDDSEFSVDACTDTIFTALFDRLRVNAEITYSDGTAETITLVFSCDSVTGDGVTTVSAKLA